MVKVGQNFRQILDRKVDTQDFKNQLDTKTDKNEHIILAEQITVLHKQIESLSHVLNKLMKIKLTPKSYDYTKC